MNSPEKKIKQYIEEHEIAAKHLVFKQSCHSVTEAAQAADAPVDDFVKNICLITPDGRLVVAILKGEDKVDLAKIKSFLSTEKPRMAISEEILERTGYPCGGTPSFGYKAEFLIDPRVMEKESVFSGGGSENSLIKISPNELLRANGGKVVDIHKPRIDLD